MRYSMFIGRFQPWHNGHKWLINQRLKKNKKVCIAVMDIHDEEPENNPYKTSEIILNITNELSKEINKGLIKIISIPPIESINYGRNVGWDIIEHIPPKNVEKISATKIRNKN